MDKFGDQPTILLMVGINNDTITKDIVNKLTGFFETESQKNGSQYIKFLCNNSKSFGKRFDNVKILSDIEIDDFVEIVTYNDNELCFDTSESSINEMFFISLINMLLLLVFYPNLNMLQLVFLSLMLFFLISNKFYYF